MPTQLQLGKLRTQEWQAGVLGVGLCHGLQRRGRVFETRLEQCVLGEGQFCTDVDADYGLVWLTWVQPGEDGELSLAFFVYDGRGRHGIRAVPLRSAEDRDLEKARDRARRIVLSEAD